MSTHETIMTAAELQAETEADKERLRGIRSRLRAASRSVAHPTWTYDQTPQDGVQAALVNLRSIEADAVTALPGCERRARQTLRNLGPVPSPRLSAEDEARFPAIDEQASRLASALTLADLEAKLREAILADDRPARLAWSLAAQRRIDAERERTNGRPSELIERLESSSRQAAAIPRPEVPDPHRRLRSEALELAEETRNLLREIDTARRSRGDNPALHDFGHGLEVTRFPDQLVERRDPSGYVVLRDQRAKN